MIGARIFLKESLTPLKILGFIIVARLYSESFKLVEREFQM